MFIRFALYTIISFFIVTPASAQTIVDSTGREVILPDNIEHVICSGPGCLRLLTYMQAEDMVVAVDDLEGRNRKIDARPYAIANQQFKDLPIFGEFRGHDNPELILSLSPQPDVIFKTYSNMGHDPVDLQQKTGIPVVILNYGNLSGLRNQFYNSLRIIGLVLDKKPRAESIISFFNSIIEDLELRTKDIPSEDHPSVYLGGVAFKGPHGFQSTEPTYPPFTFVNAKNLAYEKASSAKDLSNSIVSKETIISWDPDRIFLDLSTLRLGEKAGGLYELQTDLAYQTLTASAKNHVYGVLPYNWYTKNYGSILANSYFVGSILYPQRFTGIIPSKKADEIYTFLVGEPVFEKMNASFNHLAFKKIQVE
ncbi:MAG: iron ABC transporter substrate-binding protein [Desulfotalea sp.]